MLEDADNKMSHNPEIGEESPEELQRMLTEQQENSARLQQQVKTMKTRNELEKEKMQQQQWELALRQLKQTREQVMQEHEETMEKIKAMTTDNTPKEPNQAVAWLQSQLSAKRRGLGEEARRAREEEEQRAKLLQGLQKQQEDIQRQIADITGNTSAAAASAEIREHRQEQELLMEQL